jgi:hypothetical protein
MAANQSDTKDSRLGGFPLMGVPDSPSTMVRDTSDGEALRGMLSGLAIQNAIARHYCSLAKIEQADQRPNKSVAAKLHHFAMTEFTSVQQ